MSDDLIKRLGIIARAEMSNYAERTVNEAADTIARQQVMLDRALESNGDMQANIARLEAEVARLNAVIESRNAPDPFLCECGMSMPCMDPNCRNPLRTAAKTPPTPSP